MQLDTRLPLLAAQQPALQFQRETQLESLGKIAPAINAMRQLQAQQIDMETELRKRQAFDQFRAAAQQAGLSGDLGQLAQVFFTHGQSPEHFKIGTDLMKAAQEDARNRRMFGYPSEQAAAMAAPTGAPSMGRKFEQAPVSEAAPEMAMGAAGGAQPVNAMMAMEAPAAAMPAARPAGVYRFGDRTYTQAQIDEMSSHKDTRSFAEAIIKANEPTALERELKVFGQPTTLAGLSALEAAKRAPAQDPEEYKKYLLGQQDPAFLAYQERMRRAGATSVESKVLAYVPASEQAQGDYIKAVSEERKALRNAADTLKNVESAKALIPTASTFMGTGGQPLLAAASFLNNRLGFSIATQGVTDATVLRTRLFEGILDNLKKLDSQPSQEQQRVLSEALGNLGTDPAALPQILDRIAETMRDRVARYNQDVTDAERRGVKFPYKPQIDLPPIKPRPAAIPSATPSAAPAAAAGAPIFAINPQTGQRIVSRDGGNTWTAAPAR